MTQTTRGDVESRGRVIWRSSGKLEYTTTPSMFKSYENRLTSMHCRTVSVD